MEFREAHRRFGRSSLLETMSLKVEQSPRLGGGDGMVRDKGVVAGSSPGGGVGRGAGDGGWCAGEGWRRDGRRKRGCRGGGGGE